MQFILALFQVIGILFLVLLVFNLIIVVHELGHFLAAKWRGLRIDKFQIWFGKAIWKKTVGGVQYGLGTIPAGGFVALPQMAPMEMLEGTTDSEEPLPPISALDKIIVAFAGPLFSFGLAILCAVVVWIAGTPESRSSNSTTIGYVIPGYPADKAGLKPGDVVKSIDDQEVTTFGGMVDSIQWAVISSDKDSLKFDIERDGSPMSIDVEAEIPKDERPWYKKLFARPPIRQVGLAPQATPIFVGKTMDNSPAQMAGLEKKDQILKMDGRKLYHFAEIGLHVEANHPDQIEFLVLRDGVEKTVTVRPRVPENPGDYGEVKRVGLITMSDELKPEQFRDNVIIHPSPASQIKKTVRTMYNTITAVASPNSGISAAHLSGAPMIIYIYYKLFRNPDGWRLVLWFSVLLNVNLAILNLMPFPILDGGHITMALIETISRKPIDLRVLQFMNASCAILLIGFMVFIAGFDFRDIFNDVTGKQKVPFQFEAVENAS
tara:strand:- start:15528 stop:16997 length:1470 start_codon:yes stop_codon:yes gene_type:complete